MSAKELALAKLRSIIFDPRYHDLLAIVKGIRAGLVYGVKVRAPHAIIMSLIFHRTPWKTRLQFIYQATKQHALNLAKFVTIYKTMLLVQRRLAHADKERSGETFWAGLVGGWFVFGDRNAVNEQIVLYVVGRAVTSLLPRAPIPASAPIISSIPSRPTEPRLIPPGYPYPKTQPPDSYIFKIYAALAWGSIMWLFANRRERLQGGMVSSMQYLYLDSEVWSSLRTFFWHNV
ncbi:MAG: hypothetical protein CYPHOPRED_003469 [Cyphobasidiales sp. Tagirdzhanova-0007]|nr:MAG: hypothetical protein CYPHOPRED_003469 [Cyphobasidiales sp. Tagirdzhanova-0007]